MKKSWKEYRENRNSRLKLSGLCLACGKNPSIDNQTLCVSCKEKNALRGRISIANRKKSGKCVHCGSVALKNKNSCEICLKKRKISKKDRILNGLCVDCGSPIDYSRAETLCLRCAANHSYRSSFYFCKKSGIFPPNKKEYIEIFTDLPNRSCEICGMGYTKGNVSLHIDHDHSTGKIRGVLCEKCNKGIGLFNDSADLLKSAIKYLK